MPARPFVLLSLLLLSRAPVLAQNETPIRVMVDATDAPRRVLHSRLVIPAKPGPLTLLYPKWIPGEHGPTGPIVNLTGLKFSAGGKALPWKRDSENMFAFHLDVPEGADSVEVSLDFLSPSSTDNFSNGASTTANLAVISWNTLLLYPAGKSSDNISFRASLKLPTGWKYGTALPVETDSADGITSKPLSLTTLVDSPVIAGLYYRAVPLKTKDGGEHQIDIVADSAAALEMPKEMIAQSEQLVSEAGSLFGARHYTKYHWLITLSDKVGSFGLEHHESSDDRGGERSLIDESPRKWWMGLVLPHEYVHSWNGKYR